MSELSALGRMFLILAAVLAVVGILLLIAGQAPNPGRFHIGRLPGDIYIRKGNFTFYFLLTTGILFSIILTLLFRLFSHR